MEGYGARNDRWREEPASGMAKHKKQFAIIGLGRFGSSVAKFLSEMGYEVLAIDDNAERVQDLVNVVTHAVSADSTDEEAMRALGIRNFDVVVVAIGENIQASILTTLILKDLGVGKIIVKAQNELHGKVLNKIGADKVVFPERDMGLRVAHHLISPNIMEHIELSSDYSIVEMTAPSAMRGKNLRQLDIRAKYQCNVLAVKRDGEMNISFPADEPLCRDDVLVIVGRNEQLTRLEQVYAEP
nr:TrkA family potassium uptake protein [Cohnella fermenti]